LRVDTDVYVYACAISVGIYRIIKYILKAAMIQHRFNLNKRCSRLRGLCKGRNWHLFREI